IPGLGGRFRLGHAEEVSDGRDVVLVAMGSIATEAAAAADELARRGVRAGLVVVASVAPAPADDLAAALAQTPLALAVEAHYVAGRLRSRHAGGGAGRRPARRGVRRGVRAAPDRGPRSQRRLHRPRGRSRRRPRDT